MIRVGALGAVVVGVAVAIYVASTVETWPWIPCVECVLSNGDDDTWVDRRGCAWWLVGIPAGWVSTVKVVLLGRWVGGGGLDIGGGRGCLVTTGGGGTTTAGTLLVSSSVVLPSGPTIV